MHSLIQDIRYAARTLRRNPGFTTVAVLALALGIGANTAVFTVVNGVLLRPMPFSEPGRLFLISDISPNGPIHFGPTMPDRHFVEYRPRQRSFERIAAFTRDHVNLTGAGDPIPLITAHVTADFFPLLRVNPATGRSFLSEEDQPGRDHVVLLGDALWRNRLGADPKIVGKAIKLDGVEHTVIGIMPAGFTFPYQAEAWTPFGPPLSEHNSMALPIVGRLRPGVSPRQALAELDTLARRFTLMPGEQRNDVAPRILPLKELLVGDVRESLLVFAGAVGFVLLIACANVANLLLARAAGRQQEMTVRAALGAGRWRMVRQLLTESTLVALAGGAAGILLALWGVPALLALAPEGAIPRTDMVRIDGWVLAFTFGVSLFTGVVFGLAPAFQATRRELRESLSRSGRSLTGRHEGLRGALVVSEIALALVLLTGAGLMLKSFLLLRSVNPGFRAENVLTMTVELPDAAYHTAPQMRAFHERMLAKLSNLPGALVAGAVSFSPLGGSFTRGDFQLEGGRKLPPDFMADKPCVSPGYFHAMGIRLLRGRDFSERDNISAAGVVIVSQSVARRIWPNEDAIGKRVTEEDNPKPEDWLTIIGVVDDVRQMSLASDPDPALYYPILQLTRAGWLRRMTFAVRTASNPERLATAMRAALREVDRDQPAESISTMRDLIAASTAELRFQTRLLGAFSILALLLSAVGIYGVLAYSVAQRTHEIGIRMALGAQRSDVLRMVLRRTLMLTGAGVVAGTLGALAVTRVVAKFLFEVKRNDPATFLAVAAVISCVALAAGWIPARRATRVDPMVALRYE